MDHPGSGTVTDAAVQGVDPSFADPPAASASGCEAADVAGFPWATSRSLQRGACTFGQKVSNAEAAGAIVLHQGNSGPDRTDPFQGTLGDPCAKAPPARKGRKKPMEDMTFRGAHAQRRGRARPRGRREAPPAGHRRDSAPWPSFRRCTAMR